MQTIAVLTSGTHVAWFLIPLAAAVSLVYSGTRFEQPRQILLRSARLFVTILVAMFLVFVVLFLLSWKL